MKETGKILTTVAVIFGLYKLTHIIMTAVWDSVSENRINTLHPQVRDRVRNFLHQAEAAGIKLRVTSAYRSYEEQNALYAQGRTTAGKIVTNAKAGESSHNFGTAVDVIPIVNGAPDWNTNLWPQIAAIGRAAGFSWGGDWKSFKDYPHFEMNFGKTLAQLRDLKAQGKVKDGYVMV